jgi:hypothetical protein
MWFVVTSLLKVLSMLGLIYAVLDEIQQRYGAHHRQPEPWLPDPRPARLHPHCQ